MTELTIPIKFKLKDEEQFKKDAVEYFKEHKKLKPVRFGFTTDYAESLEYGTGPLTLYQPTVNGGNYTWKSIYDAIEYWAGRKDGKGSGLPIKDKKERAEFAKAVTNKFFTVGMRPHPYWRPAMQWMIDNMQRLFDEGYSLKEIAEEAHRVALDLILAQNLPFSGQLQISGIVDEVEWSELGDTKELKDYTEDERNKVSREGGWSAYNGYQQGNKKKG